MTEQTQLEVRDNDQMRRFEAWVDEELAGFADYRVRDDRVIFPHVEVEPRFEGRGIATELVAEALDRVVAAGRKIVPRCPFVVSFVERFPAYQEHVAAS